MTQESCHPVLFFQTAGEKMRIAIFGEAFLENLW